MPSFSVQKARNAFAARDNALAVANYLAVLKIASQHRAGLRSEFFDALIAYVGELEKEGKRETANSMFELAHELYADDATLHNAWGELLFRAGLHEEAATCFLRALAIEPSSAQARTSLRNLSTHFIDQWHFKMLNDARRNAAYEQALSLRIKCMPPPCSVLDIGTGSGLLAMLAVEGGASLVYACEESKTLCDVACCTIRDNEMEEKVLLINKNSKEIESADLHGKVSLIVCEIMDAGFFGEGIVPTIFDARRRLLRNDGIVIPHSARLFARLVECETIRREHSVVHAPILSEYALPDAWYLDQQRSLPEPYTSCTIRHMRGGYRWLSDEVPIDEIQFNDESSLQAHVDGFLRKLKFEVTTSGRLDAIVVWFDVELCPGVHLSSGETSQACAWEQAVFPCVAARSIKHGELVSVVVRLHDDRLKCEVDDGIAVSSELQVASVTDISLMNDAGLAGFYTAAVRGETCARVVDLCHNAALTLAVLESVETTQVCKLCSDEDEERLTHAYIDHARVKKDALTLVRIDTERVDLGAVTLLICSPLSPAGVLRSKSLEDIAYHRLSFGVDRVLPATIVCRGQLVTSEQLFAATCVVSDRSTLGLRIRERMNLFRTVVQQEVDLAMVEHRLMSEPEELLRLELCEPLEAASEELPKFARQCRRATFAVTMGGGVHAIVVWYELIDANGGVFSSLSASGFRQAAYMLGSDAIEVAAGDTVTVEVTLANSDILVDLVGVESAARVE